MARKERVESPTGYYHVMQRGAGKQILFEDENDYRRYLNKLTECRKCMNFEIVAYCLMNNHVHLLVHVDNIRTLSLLMNRVGSSYGKWYNVKYEHVGYVFQGRYLSEPICDERYLLACVRYIHNNPVKAGIDTREGYQWSSYNEYFSAKRNNCDTKYGLVDTEVVEAILGDRRQFEEFSEIEDNKTFLDEALNATMSSVGQDIVRRHFGNEFENTLMIKQLCVEERNKIIKEMKEAGLSCHQIELVTGVSRKLVKKI